MTKRKNKSIKSDLHEYDVLKHFSPGDLQEMKAFLTVRIFNLESVNNTIKRNYHQDQVLIDRQKVLLTDAKTMNDSLDVNSKYCQNTELSGDPTVEFMSLNIDMRFYKNILGSAIEDQQKLEVASAYHVEVYADTDTDRRSLSIKSSINKHHFTKILEIERVLNFLSEHLKEVYRPKFSQAEANLRFSSTRNVYTSDERILDKSVTEVADLIKRGKLPKECLNVCVFYYDNSWITQNNRALATASLSEIKPRLTVVMPNKDFINCYEAKKNNVDNDEELYSICLKGESTSPTQVSVPSAWSDTKRYSPKFFDCHTNDKRSTNEYRKLSKSA